MGTRNGRARCSAPETFVERVGGDALVRLMAVESGRSVLRAANLARPDMEVTRADETMIRGVVVFVGRAV